MGLSAPEDSEVPENVRFSAKGTGSLLLWNSLWSLGLSREEGRGRASGVKRFGS